MISSQERKDCRAHLQPGQELARAALRFARVPRPRKWFALLALLAAVANAQWLNYSTPGVPRTRDGKPNLAAPVPRAPGGKPDLSGVWHVQPTGEAEMKRIFGENVGIVDVPGMEIDTISKYALNILADFKPEESPMRPAAAEILRRRKATDFPPTNCLPSGIPFYGLVSEPVRIVQSPALIVVISEGDTARQIHTDGRAFPREFAQPSWMGYSIGRWKGDTLVVETAGFNDKSWLDGMGHPHSEALRVVERYHRRDFGHMDVEMTFEDPQMYAKPFTIKVTEELQPDSDVFEYLCNEDEKDRSHLR